MSLESTTEDGQKDSAQTFTQTSPLRLNEYSGADHQGRVKLTFDKSTLPSDIDDDVPGDLDWALSALNAVVHYSNLTLWVRGIIKDLFIAHHPADEHERAGHVRAATFERDERVDGVLTTDTEIECGLLTPFDAMNVLYDFLVTESYRLGYSMMLTDTIVLQNWYQPFDHPVLDIPEGIENWGRQQLLHRRFPCPVDRGRTAYPESTYPDTQYPESEFKHATHSLREHITTFALEDE